MRRPHVRVRAARHRRASYRAYGLFLPAVHFALTCIVAQPPHHDHGRVLSIGMLLSDWRLAACAAPFVAGWVGLLLFVRRGPTFATGSFERAALALGILAGVGWVQLVMGVMEMDPLFRSAWVVAALVLVVAAGFALGLRMDLRRARAIRRVCLRLRDPRIPTAHVLPRDAPPPTGLFPALFTSGLFASTMAVSVAVFGTGSERPMLLVFGAVGALAALAGPVLLASACHRALVDGHRATRAERALARARGSGHDGVPPARALLRTTPTAALGSATLVGWAAAVRSAVTEVLLLPPPPPGNCYVATAAARGHRWLVRGRDVPCEGGLRRTTPQLVTLKRGELVLAALTPRLHRAIRRVYDRVGPPIARRITTPWRADLAYLTLAPAACLTGLVLAVLRALPTDPRSPMRRADRRIT